MSKPAKPAFSSLLDGNPGNKFDARDVLAKRREARRQIPFVPICAFGFELNEGPNELPPARVEPGADLYGGRGIERAN